MPDYSQFLTTPAEPEASSMIETFRAIGYSLEAAIADIVDNSISAGAKTIWFNAEWSGSKSSVSILDDGKGMIGEEIIQAMRPGSKNPSATRDPKDLGRFGLGLKTASFSQCRQLTVLSKTSNSEPEYWTWDLDYVRDTGKWNLIKLEPKQEFKDLLSPIKSGTLIFWNQLDRLVKNVREEDEIARTKWWSELKKVKTHLSVVFHRFIGSGKLKIYFNENEIEAWDPFLANHPATQIMPEEPLYGGRIKVKGFILPHKSKLTEPQFRSAEGPNGWNSHQGFYIYRNERLLLAGDWFRMFKKEEHYKLARILIDLPNNLDEEWQIDIKKSVARPPIKLLDNLKSYASQVRARAVEVYRHKGKVLQRRFPNQEFHPIWIEKIRHGIRFYAINREHPFIKETLQSIETPDKINSLLRFVEETVPVPLITIKESEEPEKHGAAFEGADTTPIKSIMAAMLNNLINQGVEHESAKSRILSMEPFNQFPHFFTD